MLIYITIFQTIFIIILFVLYFHQKKSFAKKQSQMLMVKNKSKSDETSTPNYFGVNKRNTFRVSLDRVECLVEFLEFDDSKLNKLKHKQFNGHLENISMGGLKFICSYDIPAKHRIMIKTTFSLKDHEFCCKGEIVSKEEHSQKNLFAYGVKFTEVSDEEGMLINVLNQIIVEKRRIPN